MGISIVARCPSENQTIKPGESVDVCLSFRNTSSLTGSFYYYIKKNGSYLLNQSRHDIAGGGKSNLLRTTFIMPSSKVTLSFVIGGSAFWQKTITLTSGVEYANFKVYVRNQNNAQPINGAKVVCAGVTKYTSSNGYTDSFRAVKYTTVSYTVSKSGFQTLTRSCYINRDNDECMPYLDPSCSCGAWVAGRCLRDNYRAQTRVCTPSGCNSEWREVYDSSCAEAAPPVEPPEEPPVEPPVEPPEYTVRILHWWVVTITTPEQQQEGMRATTGELIHIAASMLHNYPSAEEFKWYVIDDDTGEVLLDNPSKSVEPGIQYHARLLFNMPSKTLNVRIELRRQT